MPLLAAGLITRPAEPTTEPSPTAMEPSLTATNRIATEPSPTITSLTATESMEPSLIATSPTELVRLARTRPCGPRW